jgi:hypothetical protein
MPVLYTFVLYTLLDSCELEQQRRRRDQRGGSHFYALGEVALVLTM